MQKVRKRDKELKGYMQEKRPEERMECKNQ
jgi:hypothetical protein